MTFETLFLGVFFYFVGRAFGGAGLAGFILFLVVLAWLCGLVGFSP